MAKKTIHTFDERFSLLNKEQKKAVQTTEGPLLVLAGPGTGKTELIALRIGEILRVGNARAENILCLTFTETASTNMRDRLLQFIGPDAHRVAIYTFHGFCTEVMGKYPEYFYNAARVRPASDLVQNEILERIFSRLPHKHPLGAYHKELGYSYLKDVKTKIQDIKKGNLDPATFRTYIEENARHYATLNALLQEHLPERISKSAVEAFEHLEEKMSRVEPLGMLYGAAIQEALEEYDATGTTAPLTAWKQHYTTKDEDESRVLKDSLQTEKLLALADIYKEYQETLFSRGYFDYEDMIIEVVSALEKHSTLRTELEEQYQYIMVDEFQDTNTAQLTLVKALSSNQVHEGRANVCVVGDDDQAVYKFQGADTSNIARFKKLYTDVTTIVLVENYRSTQEVLTVAREVITQGKNRLERHDPTLRKDLRANNKKISKGSIGMYGFHSDVEEYSFVAEQVQALIEKGEKKEEIVVIAREHKQLRAILPYLDALSIPYTYTREENVFDEQHVKELVILCRFLSAMLDERGDADHLLPEILSFPFWGLDRITVWEIAEYAKREHCSWLAAMKDSTGEKVRLIAHFLIELSVLAKTTPLEIILDTLIGSRDVPLVSDDEHDDLYEVLAPIRVDVDYSSPYKEYYFGKEVYAKNPSSYIHFLSSLRVFVKALREYKDGEILYTRDVGPFVDMHLAYNIALINNTPFAHNEESITLLTSHGAKGLEFGNVFIISAHDDIWASGSKSAKLRFPINLPLAQSPDDEDDFIRLFYVALTRARHSITITYHDQMFRVLQHESLSSYVQDQEVVKTKELLALGLKVHHAPPFANNEKALLKKVLEGYQLSPTHLNNFLNIIDGGPMKFLEQNLLRFPQAKHASSVYGTAVHKALEDMYKSYKEKGTVPALSFVTNSFEKELRRGRLMGYEEEKMCARGVEMLARYYPEEKKRLPDIVYAELDFKRQGVVVDGAHITGKIDRVIARKEGGWTVMDIKTGKPLLRWDKGTSIHEDMKIRNYKYQLMMYKMLIEHSRDYRRESVDRGVLMFVEEDDGDVTTSLELVFSQISGDEYSRFQKLVSVVYDKIINLDFPDTSTYELSRKGVEQFEEDLLSGAV